MRRSIGAAVMLALFAWAGRAGAVEVGSPQDGLRVAEARCASCHGIERGAEFSPNLMAPTFEAVALTPGMTATALSVALRTSHRQMPDLILGSEEISAITAYILSLKHGD